MCYRLRGCPMYTTGIVLRSGRSVRMLNPSRIRGRQNCACKASFRVSQVLVVKPYLQSICIFSVFADLFLPRVRAYRSPARVRHACKGNQEGCPALASSRTHPSGVCSSPVGCAGARQQPPNSVEAKARCNAHPSCPHHRRFQIAREARLRTRSCAFCLHRSPTSAARTTRRCGPGPASSG